jgi:superfamily II DNA or RNA helicase
MIEFDYDSTKKLGIIKSDLLEEIREHFSIKNENAKFMRRYGRFLPPRTYAITPTGRFEPSLYFEILKYLTSINYVGSVVRSKAFVNVTQPALHNWHQQLDYNADIIPLKIPLREYQEDIVKKCMSTGRGTIILATAGGKTLTSASILTQIHKLYISSFNKGTFKCLFIVPDRGLVEQTTSDFLEYGVPFSVSKWTGDDDINHESNVIVANLGILQSKNTKLDFLKDIDVLFVDEVHKIRKGNEINKLFKKLDTPFRFGLTGTMPEELLDQWNIIGKIGPVLYEKHSYDLRQDKYISGAQIQILKIHHKSPVVEAVTADSNVSDKYRAEIKTLITSEFRNRTISKLTGSLPNNSLVMVDFIEHGELLYEITARENPTKQVYFIRGEVELAERERIRQLIEVNNNVIIIAISKIFSTGINIKNLHYIVFACGGKAKVKIVQSIGRGLRLHKDKTQLIIFDIADNYKYSTSHLEKRILLYGKEKIKFALKDIYEA